MVHRDADIFVSPTVLLNRESYPWSAGVPAGPDSWFGRQDGEDGVPRRKNGKQRRYLEFEAWKLNFSGRVHRQEPLSDLSECGSEPAPSARWQLCAQSDLGTAREEMSCER